MSTHHTYIEKNPDEYYSKNVTSLRDLKLKTVPSFTYTTSPLLFHSPMGIPTGFEHHVKSMRGSVVVVCPGRSRLCVLVLY